MMSPMVGGGATITGATAIPKGENIGGGATITGGGGGGTTTVFCTTVVLLITVGGSIARRAAGGGFRCSCRDGAELPIRPPVFAACASDAGAKTTSKAASTDNAALPTRKALCGSPSSCEFMAVSLPAGCIG